MNTRPNSIELLAETGGNSRLKPATPEEPADPVASKHRSPPRAEEKARQSAITVHFRKQVRDQLKILATPIGNALHGVVAEAFNEFFANHGKPEIAPAESVAPVEQTSWRNSPCSAGILSFEVRRRSC